ncbi:MAG: 4-hydroxythreonine-4-phosphate dehydrogenase PdxA [Desulfobacter sp.]|nr:4-hydroxythreonine-4-phosphate dehydrogenase PdxA [Desulfobacter sp.]
MKSSQILPVQSRPIIGITMGDPAGIGPEIIVQALEHKNITKICKPVVIGDKAILEKAVSCLNSSMTLFPIDRVDQFSDNACQINLIQVSTLDPNLRKLKIPSRETGKAMENYILKGVDLALNNDIQAMVTAPITKTGLKMAGSQFHGHTELIAHRTQTQDFAMMMAGTKLKVVLATIHIPLADVACQLTCDTIIKIADLTCNALIHRFGIDQPRLAVAGLNPHAGEDSMFGREEEDIIRPAVEAARKKGYHIQGPLPPDTVFYNALKGKFDAVICMYHDQGLIPFKLIHFKDGVNTTLGLPIIRTSVDHGTAYDIAWTGKADESSLKEAINMAVLQAQHVQGSANGQR